VKADVVICSHPWSSLSLKKENGQVFIYDAHNCEYRLMERILGSHWLKGAVLEQVKKIEGDACRKSDLVLVCSEKEKKDFMDLYKVDPRKILMVPNGTNIISPTDEATRMAHRERLAIKPAEKVLVFIGAYYKPNNDATKFILTRLAAELPDFKFLIVGSVRDAFMGQDIPANVKFTGQVSEEGLDSALRASDIAINPMFTGAGIHIKMFDYMSYGLPVVTTPVGARGIETKGREAMVICEPNEFAASIQKLFVDRAWFERLTQAGREVVAEDYDWKKISGRVQDAILRILGHDGTAS
jgi:glycosyltransferase involved in cell wall biosynthesis